MYVFVYIVHVDICLQKGCKVRFGGTVVTKVCCALGKKSGWTTLSNQ